MNTTTQTTEVNTINLLVNFVNQRPGLNFADYGNRAYYLQDYREILKDLHSFNEFFKLASRRIDNLNAVLFDYLIKSNDRLTLKESNGVFKLQYITGQYFPTEYRSAACRVLCSIIWNDYANEINSNGEYIYKDGHEIRKAIKRNLSSRNSKQYFN